MNPHNPTPRAVDPGLEAEFEILDELGRGGVSVVYLARDRVLGRKVAIKVIRDVHMVDEEAITRFEREARVLAELQHPNIVTLFAAKRLSAGSLALVMQHGNWRTLKTALRDDSPLSPTQIGEILRDVGSALLYLHRMGMVHRDVKPENIFLERETGRALLSDFGIAKHRDSQTSVTLTGVVIGTPAYMSPEQIDGEELDGRSDLYSLGMVGYEMVTGQRPWEGESLYGVIFKQKKERLPALRSVRSDMPEDLCGVIETAIEKQKENRWSGMEEFLAQLSGVGSGIRLPALPAEADPPAPGEDAQEPSHESLMVQVHRAVSEAEPGALAAPAKPARARRLALAASILVLLGSGGIAALALAKSEEAPYAFQQLPLSAEEPARLHVPEAPQATEGDSAGLGSGPSYVSSGPAVDGPSPLGVPEPPAQEPGTATSRLPTVSEPPPASSARTPAPRRAAGTTVDSQSPPDRSRELLGRPLELATPGIGVVDRRGASPAIGTEAVVLRTFAPRAASEVGSLELLNRADIGRLLGDHHPVDMRMRGIGGDVVVSLLVSETGSILQMGIVSSSGAAALDSAAVQVARFMRFSPAEDLTVPRRTWVNVPLTFPGRPAGEP